MKGKGWVGLVCWGCGGGNVMTTATVANGAMTVYVCAGCVADNVSTMTKKAA